MLPRGSAVQLVDPDLPPAHVVRVPCVVLNIKPEISSTLLGFLQKKSCETGGNRVRQTDRR